jgi:hypothetical protein
MAEPEGSTVAFSVAPVLVTAVALPVTATGGASVVNVSSGPLLVPSMFEATIRKC